MSKKKSRKRMAAWMQQQGQASMPTMLNGMVIANGTPTPNQHQPNPGNSLNGGNGPKPAKRRRLEKKKKKQQMKQIKLEQQQEQQLIVLGDSSDEASQFSDPRASTSNEENFVHIIGTSRAQVELWAREVELPSDYERTSVGVIANTALLGIFDRVKAFRTIAEPAFQRLDYDIWRHYNTNKQSADVLQHKQFICGKLETAIRKILGRPDARLFAVGSTVNGCGSYNSDMDLCLTLPMPLPGLNPDGTPQFAQLNYDTCKRVAVKTLHKVNAMLRNQRNQKDSGLGIAKTNVIKAKVPIIKMELNHPMLLELDINVNNIPGIYNSHLLRYYAELDRRFPALALLIKHWAITNGINDSMNGTFNSYSLIMLLLHYLMCGVKPTILPNLQYLFPHRFAQFVNLDTLLMNADIRADLPQRPQNTATVGELLVGFFEYYATFDFDSLAISIRAGRVFHKSELAQNQQRYCIFIEEPYDFQNTARCVRHIEPIREAFRQTALALKRPNFTLHDIKVNPGTDEVE